MYVSRIINKKNSQLLSINEKKKKIYKYTGLKTLWSFLKKKYIINSIFVLFLVTTTWCTDLKINFP